MEIYRACECESLVEDEQRNKDEEGTQEDTADALRHQGQTTRHARAYGVLVLIWKALSSRI